VSVDLCSCCCCCCCWTDGELCDEWVFDAASTARWTQTRLHSSTHHTHTHRLTQTQTDRQTDRQTCHVTHTALTSMHGSPARHDHTTQQIHHLTVEPRCRSGDHAGQGMLGDLWASSGLRSRLVRLPFPNWNSRSRLHGLATSIAADDARLNFYQRSSVWQKLGPTWGTDSFQTLQTFHMES